MDENSKIVVYSLLLQLLCLLLVVIFDTYLKTRTRKVLLCVIALEFVIVVQNYVGYWLDVDSTMPRQRTIVGIVGYTVRPAIIATLIELVDASRKHVKAWILVVLNFFVHLTALFSGICFKITADDTFVRGPLGYTCHVVSGLLLLQLFFCTYRLHHKSRKRNQFILFIIAVSIVLSVILDMVVDYKQYVATFLTVTTVTAVVFYYIWLNWHFVFEHEEDLKAQQRIKIMMSQIQPHFLYNTLATIQALCKKNPEQAADITGKFAMYLRQNLDSLDKAESIPFEEEMQHTRIYSEIEMVRFPNIHVEEDLEDKDFILPALTIQPMVENAIRHGVRIRKNGIIKISSRRDGDFHEIVIEDNGKGFDVNKPREADGRSHIGVNNVRDRIIRMTGGTFTIDSVIDEGTKICIRIPVSKKEN